ncbi:TPA: N-acetylmuramic acid 6-phosphate etherase, partial [Vibrio cholerae]|nr:N-acetylmuramic acid 6-phosphate etherase [Vibrio cholerae]
EEAEALLKESHNNAKLAILMHLTGMNYEQATAKLSQSDGFLRRAMEEHEE